MNSITYANPDGWLQELTVIGTWADEETDDVLTLAEQQCQWMPREYALPGVTPTDFEERLITLVIAFAEAVRADLGLTTRGITRDRVMVMDAAAFSEAFNKQGAGAVISGQGFVYLKRDHHAAMASALAHEFGHLHSFQRRTLDVDLAADPERCQAEGLSPYPKVQMGLHTIERNLPGGSVAVRNHGFNEATTDIFAERLLLKLIQTDLLTDEQRMYVMKVFGYEYAMGLIKAIGLYACGDETLAIDSLLIDAMTGSTVFMDTVGRRYDTTPVTLMGPTPASVQATATALGLIRST